MKRHLLFFIALAFILFFEIPVLAEIEIKAKVDKNRLSTDELLTYKLTIASGEKNIPPPQLPKFAGFNIVSQAESTTVSFVKSKIKNILVYAFILAPIDSGKFNIEPSQIRLKNKTYQTQPFDIEVTAGKVKPIIPQQPQENLPPELPEEQANKTTL